MEVESFDVEYLLSESDNDDHQDVLEKAVAFEKKAQPAKKKRFENFSECEKRKLAKLVSKHECLYKLENKFYKHSKANELAWKNIAEAMGKNGMK